MTRRNVLFATALLSFGVFFASGCWVEVEDDGVHTGVGLGVDVDVDVQPALADLEVSWTIDRGDSATLCSIYGVDRWRVTIYGPESRDSVLDCRANWWSTEADLYGLPHGDYRLTITGLDRDGMIRGSLSTPVYLYGLGLERVQVDFDGRTL